MIPCDGENIRFMARGTKFDTAKRDRDGRASGALSGTEADERRRFKLRMCGPAECRGTALPGAPDPNLAAEDSCARASFHLQDQNQN